eukprot:scaffold79442_cov66-Phaeocystis_antarctica.AAC.7
MSPDHFVHFHHEDRPYTIEGNVSDIAALRVHEDHHGRAKLQHHAELSDGVRQPEGDFPSNTSLVLSRRCLTKSDFAQLDIAHFVSSECANHQRGKGEGQPIAPFHEGDIVELHQVVSEVCALIVHTRRAHTLVIIRLHIEHTLLVRSSSFGQTSDPHGRRDVRRARTRVEVAGIALLASHLAPCAPCRIHAVGVRKAWAKELDDCDKHRGGDGSESQEQWHFDIEGNETRGVTNGGWDSADGLGCKYLEQQCLFLALLARLAVRVRGADCSNLDSFNLDSLEGQRLSRWTTGAAASFEKLGYGAEEQAHDQCCFGVQQIRATLWSRPRAVVAERFLVAANKARCRPC